MTLFPITQLLKEIGDLDPVNANIETIIRMCRIAATSKITVDTNLVLLEEAIEMLKPSKAKPKLVMALSNLKHVLSKHE